MKNNEILTSLGNIKKVPKGLKLVEKMGFKNVLNFGCGYGYKYHTEQMKELNLINYDLYIPELAILPSKDTKIDIVVCNNVLNVIEDDAVVLTVLETLESYNKPILITIYEGDKSGTGKITSKKTYQRNLKSKDYTILKERDYKFKNGVWTKGV